MTLSTEPEVHKVSQLRALSEEDWATANGKMYDRVAFDLCERTDGQT